MCPDHFNRDSTDSDNELVNIVLNEFVHMCPNEFCVEGVVWNVMVLVGCRQ